jgi:hypothetical protein
MNEILAIDFKNACESTGTGETNTESLFSNVQSKRKALIAHQR